MSPLEEALARDYPKRETTDTFLRSLDVLQRAAFILGWRACEKANAENAGVKNAEQGRT